tara:strand:- start:1483 stop:1656 length:174 start_codon:yes stop_codon:yes gene_type:complete
MPKHRTCGRYDQLTQRKEYQHDYYVRNKEKIKKNKERRRLAKVRFALYMKNLEKEKE